MRKAKVVVLMLTLLMCLVLAACNCEHQYEEKITTEASCTAVGVKTFTCTECNESYTEEIPMVEHTYTSAVTKESTCSEKGVTTFTCTACNDSYTEEIAMIDHTFGETTVTKEPTCVAEGEKTATCTVCGATEVAEKIPTVAHSYQSKVKVAATCTEKGVNTLTCSVCNDSKEEATNALGHNHKQSKVITQVTCTANGEVTMTCTRCNDSYNETKKATGHDWIEATCTEPKHCDNCYLTEGESLGHNYQNGECAQCGKSSSSVQSKDSFPFTLREKYYECDITFENVTFSVSQAGAGKIRITVNVTAHLTNHDGTGALNDFTFRICVTDSNGNTVSIYPYMYHTFKEYGGKTSTISCNIGTLDAGDYYIDIRSVV